MLFGIAALNRIVLIVAVLLTIQSASLGNVTVEITEVAAANPNPTLRNKPSRGSLSAQLKDDGTNMEIKPDENTTFTWSVDAVSLDGVVNASFKSGVTITDGDKQTMRYQAQWDGKGTYVITFKVVAADPNWTPNSVNDSSDVTIKVGDCTTATSVADVQDEVLTNDPQTGQRQAQGSVATVSVSLTVCTDTNAITMDVSVTGKCLDQTKTTQFSASPVLSGFGAGAGIMNGGNVVGFKFSKQIATLDVINGNKGSNLLTYQNYAEGEVDSETSVGGVVGIFTEFGRHVCIRWKVASTGEIQVLEAKQGPSLLPGGGDPRALCVAPN